MKQESTGGWCKRLMVIFTYGSYGRMIEMTKEQKSDLAYITLMIIAVFVLTR